MSPKQAAACCRPVDALLDPGLFKALCDPTRARLFGCLIKCAKACTVSEVAECCNVDLSVVSRHLQTLERAGVITGTREGRTVRYAVEYPRLCRTMRALADAVEQCCPNDQRALCAPGCCDEPNERKSK